MIAKLHDSIHLNSKALDKPIRDLLRSAYVKVRGGAALNEQDWRALRGIADRRAIYVRVTILEKLQRLNLIVLSWRYREGVSLSAQGKAALLADEATSYIAKRPELLQRGLLS